MNITKKAFLIVFPVMVFFQFIFVYIGSEFFQETLNMLYINAFVVFLTGVLIFFVRAYLNKK